MSQSAIDTLARTIFGEARGELYGGKAAVASVVINRVINPRVWWGEDVISVCRYPYQFSCWNENDPNRKVIESVTEDDPDFEECLNIARDAISGLLQDITFGSCHYHTVSVTPGWAEDKKPVVQIGVHLYYNNVE